MYSSERNKLRHVIFTAWQKHLQKQLLEPLEAQIVDVVLCHPEYHEMLTDADQFQDQDFGDTNPFLHLSLHLALREQIATNRPAGILQVYETLCKKLNNPLAAEHSMMECLEEVLWEAQRTSVAPDENLYLEKLKSRIN